MKAQRICETTPEIHFISPKKEFQRYWSSFLGSELGGIYHSIPWNEIVKSLKLKECTKGPRKIFSSQCMLALMVLKSYTTCSGRKLIVYLNGSIYFQLFCGIFLGANRITNYKIISEIRCQLSGKLQIKALQKVLAHHWKLYMPESNIMLTDATCY